MHHLAHPEGIQDHIEERLQEVRARHHRFQGLHAEWLRYHSNRRSLQRQMFKGFGIAIALTTAAVGLIVWLVSGGATFQKDSVRAKAYLVHRFEEAWPDPAARKQLVDALARDMVLGVRTFDARGVELERAGKIEKCRKHAEAPIGQVG